MNAAPNEEEVKAALHYAYNHHTDEEKRLLRNIEPHGDLHPWVPAMQILAAEVRRLRGSNPQNSHPA